MRRDPETGQFVSGSGSATDVRTWSETEQVTGAVSYTINAADLSGGTVTRELIGNEATKVVDFNAMLANDEVLILDAMQVVAGFGFPTTATAESSGYFSYAITPQNGANAESQHSSPFYKGSANVTNASDNIDVNHGWRDGESALAIGNLKAEASLNDTTNATGAGADYENERYTVSFRSDYGARPAYDQDDGLYVPMEFGIDNVSDHAVDATVKVLLQGEVEELD